MSELGLCAVTGGHGFLGHFLCLYLTEFGYKVRVLDIIDKPRNWNQAMFHKLGNPDLMEYIKCDITNTKELASALLDVNTIFHTCSITDIRQCPNMANLYNVNVNATRKILNLVTKNKRLSSTVRNFIYTSSIAVLAQNSHHLIQVDEKTPKINVTNYNYFRNNYAKSKRMAEDVIESFKNDTSNNIRYAILRISSLFGPFDPIFDGRIHKLRASRHRMLAASGLPDGRELSKMSFNYVENVCKIMIIIARNLDKSCIKNEIFHTKCFDANRTDLNRYRILNIGKKYQENEYRIRYYIIVIFALLYDLIAVIAFGIFGKRMGEPMLAFGKFSIDMICYERTFNDSKLKNALIKCQDSNDEKFRLFTKDEAIQRTQYWIKKLDQLDAKKDK